MYLQHQLIAHLRVSEHINDGQARQGKALNRRWAGGAHLDVIGGLQYLRPDGVLLQDHVVVHVHGAVPQLSKAQRPPDLAVVEGPLAVARPLRQLPLLRRGAVQVARDAHLLSTYEQTDGIKILKGDQKYFLRIERA